MRKYFVPNCISVLMLMDYTELMENEEVGTGTEGPHGRIC